MNVRYRVSDVVADEDLEDGGFVEPVVAPELDDRKSGLAPILDGSSAALGLVSGPVLAFRLVGDVQRHLGVENGANSLTEFLLISYLR